MTIALIVFAAWLVLVFVAWALCAMAGRADDDDGWRNGHA